MYIVTPDNTLHQFHTLDHLTIYKISLLEKLRGRSIIQKKKKKNRGRGRLRYEKVGDH